MLQGSPASWMMSEALDVMVRAKGMSRLFFGAASGDIELRRRAPPVDDLETDSEILAFAAPVAGGCRVPRSAMRRATIHHLKPAQGGAMRRVTLPEGQYTARRLAMKNTRKDAG